ncbi:unnamed protein product, partial [Choristocarpus tenellus]
QVPGEGGGGRSSERSLSLDTGTKIVRSLDDGEPSPALMMPLTARKELSQSYDSSGLVSNGRGVVTTICSEHFSDGVSVDAINQNQSIGVKQPCAEVGHDPQGKASIALSNGGGGGALPALPPTTMSPKDHDLQPPSKVS